MNWTSPRIDEGLLSLPLPRKVAAAAVAMLSLARPPSHMSGQDEDLVGSRLPHVPAYFSYLLQKNVVWSGGHAHALSDSSFQAIRFANLPSRKQRRGMLVQWVCRCGYSGATEAANSASTFRLGMLR